MFSLILLFLPLKMVRIFNHMPLLQKIVHFICQTHKIFRRISPTCLKHKSGKEIACMLDLVWPLYLLWMCKRWRRAYFAYLRLMWFLLLPCLLRPWSQRSNSKRKLVLHILQGKKKNEKGAKSKIKRKKTGVLPHALSGLRINARIRFRSLQRIKLIWKTLSKKQRNFIKNQVQLTRRNLGQNKCLHNSPFGEATSEMIRIYNVLIYN